MHIKHNNKKLPPVHKKPPPVHKKPPPVQKKPPPVQKKPEAKKEPEADENKGPLDEKGNPFPIPDPEGGGDPICPGGYQIDNQFDIFDPINPLFRCITSLKEDGDGGGMAKKMLAMANTLPIGGRRGRKPTRGTKIRRSVRHCCRTRRRCRRSQ